jgi:hypothetical protein
MNPTEPISPQSSRRVPASCTASHRFNEMPERSTLLSYCGVDCRAYNVA